MRILLANDERKSANFVGRSLRENAYSVDITKSGNEALEMATEVSYDAILLDFRIPLDGIEVCRELRRSGVYAPILIFTTLDRVQQRIEGLDAGADDYVSKPFVLAELHARIRSLIRRTSRYERGSLQYADLEIDRRRLQVRRGTATIQLTLKEFALLEFLLVQAPDLVTRSEIVEHVWDSHFDSETNVVEVYINRLRHKLDYSGSAKLIHTVRGVGYRLSVAQR